MYDSIGRVKTEGDKFWYKLVPNINGSAMFRIVADDPGERVCSVFPYF